MKIRAGAKYVRNDGVVVTLHSWKPPIGQFSQDKWKFVDHKHNNLYTAEGKHEDPVDDHWDIAGPYVPKEKR